MAIFITRVKRMRLSNRDVRELKEIYPHMRPVLEEAEVVEVVLLFGDNSLYLIDGEPLFLKTVVKDVGEVIVPTLFFVHKSTKSKLFPQYPRAVVDAGAIKPIVNGADVMRPGIRELVGEFNRGDVVSDEKGRVIAVAVALFSKAEIVQMQKGKVLLNIHHLGDKLWQISLELAKKA